MATTICRIGVFYDGNCFNEARKYFYYSRKAGWLSFQPFHECIQNAVKSCERGYTSHRVVYAAWFQGMFAAEDANEKQLKFDRRHHHDLVNAGIQPKFHPMSQGQQKKEKGVDVALAIDALQAGLDGEIDVAALVTADGDFVPLVHALLKVGIPTIAVYFEFEYEYKRKTKDGYERRTKDSHFSPRLEAAVAYTLDVTKLARDDPQRLFPESPKTDPLPDWEIPDDLPF